MIIGLTGLARCGKDSVAKYLNEKYGYELLIFSDILVEEAKKRLVEPTKMNLSKLGDEMRQAEGNAVLAKRLLMSINTEKNYAISGFRSPEEVYCIQNEIIDFHLINVNADKATRFKRRTEQDPTTEEEFFKRDELDMKNKGLSKVIEMADYTVNNIASLEELYSQIDAIIRKIRSE